MIVKIAIVIVVIIILLILTAFVLHRKLTTGSGEVDIKWPSVRCHSKDLINECMQYVKSKSFIDGGQCPQFKHGNMSDRAIKIMNRMENSYKQPYEVNKNIKQESEEYEGVVGEYLSSHNLSFLTENDIRKLNQSGDMKSALTPDFLFEQPIIIEHDGKQYKVNWIDAKDYGCWDSKLVTKKVQHQVDKYNAEFGPGALVYSCGVMCGHSMRNTLCLTL